MVCITYQRNAKENIPSVVFPHPDSSLQFFNTKRNRLALPTAALGRKGLQNSCLFQFIQQILSAV